MSTVIKSDMMNGGGGGERERERERERESTTSHAVWGRCWHHS